MDEFEKRLKQDAAAIDAEIGPVLQRRLDASLQGVEPLRPAAVRKQASTRLWWASSLTGLAAAVAVIAILNWNRPGPETLQSEPVASLTVPDLVEPLVVPPGLDVRTADFTRPLETELENLRSDMEKARETVRKDLDFTF
jgi:hypothetical protein